MKFIKRSNVVKPKISLILLDWSVRESFHLLHYLAKQSLPREQFEVIIIEYFSTISKAIKKFASQVDTWFLLEMPSNCYYHKHLMYNTGIAIAKGDIIILCDSDAMVKPTFLQSILTEFEKDPHIVLHLDQFRNNRKDFYPFCYPSFAEVLGEGCINNIAGKTKGLRLTEDLIHERNYGACLCAKRIDLINIGGADEHIDFVGHICGPYDLTFRLINLGKKEVWHQEEFLYHTWHPGQAGVDNYLGPHDGKHMSTTSLEAIFSRRIFPHVINPYIDYLANSQDENPNEQLNKLLISEENLFITKLAFLKSDKSKIWAKKKCLNLIYWGHLISGKPSLYYASPLLNVLSKRPYTLQANDLSLLRRKILQKILRRIPSIAINWFVFFPCLLKVLLTLTWKKTKFFLGYNFRPFLVTLIVNYIKIIKKKIKDSSKYRLAVEKYTAVGMSISTVVYFLKKVYKKLGNICVGTKVKSYWFLSVLLNLSLINKSNKKIFFLINASVVNLFLLYFCIIFLRKNFIQIKRIKHKEDLVRYLKLVDNTQTVSQEVFIVDKKCFLQFGADLLRNGSIQSFII